MNSPETFDDILRKALSVFPNAEIDEGPDGELVIYTNLVPVVGDGDLYVDDGATA